MAKVCVLLLIGLPGSGKTELCKLLLSKLPVIWKRNSSFRLKHVCYDEILSNTLSEGEWRMERDEILHSTQKTIECLIQSQSNDGHLIILIDDNMYYQSMRRLYYRLASKQNYSFCQLYLRCDLETALKRVEIRNLQPGSVQVTREVIQLMATRLEPPDVSSNWESMSLTIDTAQEIPHLTSACLEQHFFYCVNGSSGEQVLLNSIQELIEASFAHTEQIHSTAPREAPVHQPANETVLQTLDIVFRKCISFHIQAAKMGGTNSEDLNVLAQKLNGVRRTFLKTKEGCDFLSDTDINSYVENIISKHMK